MKTVTITVGTDGSVILETQGFTGKLCKVETEAIKKALGDVTAEQDTAEALRTTPLGQRAVQR